MTRTGKIARLPAQIREQLNLRILDGEPGIQLVAWLNTLPEVQAIMSRDFNDRPVTEQNLSEWKKAGYPDWLNNFQASSCLIAMADDARQVTETLHCHPSDSLSSIITVRLSLLLSRISNEAETEDIIRALTQITRNLQSLRRGDQSAERLQLAKARIATAGVKREEHIVAQFRDWMNQNNGWKFVTGSKDLSEEQRIARVVKLLFGKTEDPNDISQFLDTDTQPKCENPASQEGSTEPGLPS